MQTWTTTVLVEAVKGYNPIPKQMTTQARSYQEALAYFQTFGKVIATVRTTG
jgi:hypothetical protein